jgi:NitT/TauT family transport system substrate-binding protein
MFNLPGATRAWFAALSILVAASTSANSQAVTLRVGHFPNVTHVQALVAHNLSRSGKGWFEQRLGPDVKIEWFVYNAGPSAVEAIFANSLDLTYVGPSPAINAYAKARGDEIRIVSGAANGGAALVIQPDLNAKAAADFRGRKIATPQLGNTFVLPTQNADQLSLFKQKQLDGVWTVEPWVSRLEMEAQGKVLVEEAETVTTVLVARAKFLDGQRDLVRNFVSAHDELTEWIKSNPDEAQRIVGEEITAETRSTVSTALIKRAWSRLILTTEVTRASLQAFMTNAQAVGFLRGAPDLSRLVEKP